MTLCNQIYRDYIVNNDTSRLNQIKDHNIIKSILAKDGRLLANFNPNVRCNPVLVSVACTQNRNAKHYIFAPGITPYFVDNYRGPIDCLPQKIIATWSPHFAARLTNIEALIISIQYFGMEAVKFIKSEYRNDLIPYFAHLHNKAAIYINWESATLFHAQQLITHNPHNYPHIPVKYRIDPEIIDIVCNTYPELMAQARLDIKLYGNEIEAIIKQYPWVYFYWTPTIRGIRRYIYTKYPVIARFHRQGPNAIYYIAGHPTNIW